MSRLAIERVLENDSSYAALFVKAFGDRMITFERVSQAIASFERTLMSGNSAFDRFYFLGKTEAISESARRGWKVFTGKGACATCHIIDHNHPFFTDFSFHNTGVEFEGDHFDPGRYLATGDQHDKGRFRTPSLRNVAQTAPYMHGGCFATLSEVIAFYNRGGGANPALDGKIRPLHLTPEEEVDIIRFLESLNGKETEGTVGQGTEYESRLSQQ